MNYSGFRTTDRWAPRKTSVLNKSNFTFREYDSYRPSSSHNSRRDDHRYEGSSSASSYSTVTKSPTDTPSGFGRTPPSRSPTTPRSPVAYTSKRYGKEPPKGPRAITGASLPVSVSPFGMTNPAARAWTTAQKIVRQATGAEHVIQPTEPAPPLPPSRPNEEKALKDPVLMGMILEHPDGRALCCSLRVSKAWFDRATDVLWKALDDVEPLFRLLPAAGELKQLDLRKAQRTSYNYKKWERFKLYAARVRSLNTILDGGMLLPLPWTFFKASPGHLFKSLDSIFVRDARASDHDTLRFFLSQSARLRRLAISYDDDGSDLIQESVKEFWDEITTYTPLLERLDVSGGFREDMPDLLDPAARKAKRAQLERVIGSCPDLKHFVFAPLMRDEYFRDPSDMLVAAAHHRKLERLQLTYPAMPFPKWDAIAPTEGSVAFQHLRVLEFGTSMDHLEHFFSSPRILSRLEELTVSFDGECMTIDDIQHLEAFLGSFAKHRKTFKSLIFQDRGYTMPEDVVLKECASRSVSYSTLKALKTMSGLHTFVFDFHYPFDLSDRELVSLFQTHNLRVLKLNSTYFLETERIHRLSPNVLPLLSEALPDLEELMLCIDTNVPYHLPGKKCSCWKHFAKFRALRKVHLGCSPIHNQSKLYRLLAHMLPSSTQPWQIEGGIARMPENRQSAFTLNELISTWKSCKQLLSGGKEASDAGSLVDQLFEPANETQGLSEAALANLEVNNLAKERDKWKSRAVKMKNELKQSQAEVAERETQLAEAQTKIERSEEVKDISNEIIDARGADIGHLEEELREAQRETARARIETKNAILQAAKAQEEANTARIVFKTLDAKSVSAREDTVKILEQRVASLTAELDKLHSPEETRKRSEAERVLARENAAHRMQGSVPLDVHEREVKARTESERALKSGLQSAKEEVERARTELRAVRERSSKLESELAEAKRNHEESEKKHEALENETDSGATDCESHLRTQNRLIQRDLDILNGIYDELSDKFEKLYCKKGYAGRDKELKQLRAQIKEAKVTAENVAGSHEDEIKKLKETERGLRKKLKEAQTKLVNQPPHPPPPLGPLTSPTSSMPTSTPTNATPSSHPNDANGFVGDGGSKRVAGLTSLVGQQSERIGELEGVVAMLGEKLARQAQQALERGYRLS